MADAPRLLEPKAAAEVLQRTLDPTKPVTVADASVASGLGRMDAEAGLHWLTSEYRGHLRVTEDGDLVHLFPTGFTKPWETKERWERLLKRAGDGLLGVGRFVVRAWLLLVMVGYALLFLALILGLTFSRGSDSRDERPGFGLLGALLRMILDAAYWTFHPFSPLYYDPYVYDRRDGYEGFVAGRGRARENAGEDVPFYEKVNRFVFGPPRPKDDPRAVEARLLGEIRARRGRITLTDVMRISGLPRSEADPLMARLLVLHDGNVDVSEGGGIVYRFEELRRSASATPSTTAPVAPAWERPPVLPPLTGNSTGANVGVGLLNGFNLLASAWAISSGLTLHNLALLFSAQPHHAGRVGHAVPAFEPGVPILLGVVPLVFSVALFALPLARLLLRARETRRLTAERARLGVLREVITHVERKEPLPDEAVRTAIRVATGAEPTSAEVTKRIVELGGDVDVGPEGEVRYRFAELEADDEAVVEARERANEAEARLGPIVFASDS